MSSFSSRKVAESLLRNEAFRSKARAALQEASASKLDALRRVRLLNECLAQGLELGGVAPAGPAAVPPAPTQESSATDSDLSDSGSSADSELGEQDGAGFEAALQAALARDQRVAAAVKIQAAFRGHRARQEAAVSRQVAELAKQNMHRRILAAASAGLNSQHSTPAKARVLRVLRLWRRYTSRRRQRMRENAARATAAAAEAAKAAAVEQAARAAAEAEAARIAQVKRAAEQAAKEAEEAARIAEVKAAAERAAREAATAAEAAMAAAAVQEQATAAVHAGSSARLPSPSSQPQQQECGSPPPEPVAAVASAAQSSHAPPTERRESRLSMCSAACQTVCEVGCQTEPDEPAAEGAAAAAAAPSAEQLASRPLKLPSSSSSTKQQRPQPAPAALLRTASAMAFPDQQGAQAQLVRPQRVDAASSPPPTQSRGSCAGAEPKCATAQSGGSRAAPAVRTPSNLHQLETVQLAVDSPGSVASQAALQVCHEVKQRASRAGSVVGAPKVARIKSSRPESAAALT